MGARQPQRRRRASRASEAASREKASCSRSRERTEKNLLSQLFLHGGILPFVLRQLLAKA
jgi:hypothetical protein